MGLFSFGKQTRHQKFKFIPRFYDPEKEDLENRLRRYKDGDSLSDQELAKERIKSGFQTRSRMGTSISRKESTTSVIRLIVIIMMLVLITYFIMTSDKFITIIENLSG